MLKQTRRFFEEYLEDPAHWWKNYKWRSAVRVSDLKVIFVVGAPRSGTTLMQRVLASHDALFTIERETDLFSMRNIFSKQRPFFDLSRPEINELLESSSDIVHFFENGVNELMRRNQSRVFVEKTPQHVKHLQFLMEHFPLSKIVHVLRDGRDCYRSAKEHPNIKQKRSAKVFARYWKKCVSFPLKLGPSERVLTVKYEDFVSEPEVILRSVMRFLGLAYQSSQLDRGAYGNDRRANLDQFRRISSAVSPVTVGKWRVALTPHEKKIFLKIAGEELADFGYEV